MYKIFIFYFSLSQQQKNAFTDPSNNQGGNMLPENNGGEGGGSYPLGYHPNAQNQPFVGGGGGDLPNINQSFQDPSQVDVGHHIPPPPNPRSEYINF